MKNIVVCCDGTNNQLESDPTNVLRMYSVLERDPQRQIGYYEPGVGTSGQPGTRGAIAKRLSLAYGQAFGVGFTRNLEDAYRFPIRNYEPGDRLFLFGFSRGALTVRALAGMVNMFGLSLPPQDSARHRQQRIRSLHVRVNRPAPGFPACEGRM
jgi:uncharacterized protein (DUF2235 family)